MKSNGHDAARKLGETLRTLRQVQGLSIEALAHDTRIKPQFIEALESGIMSDLPGRVFGRGFVKSICKSLNAAESDLVAQFDACWRPESHPKLHVQVDSKLLSRGVPAVKQRAPGNGRGRKENRRDSASDSERRKPGKLLPLVFAVAAISIVLVAVGVYWQTHKEQDFSAARVDKDDSSESSEKLVIVADADVAAVENEGTAPPVENITATAIPSADQQETVKESSALAPPEQAAGVATDLATPNSDPMVVSKGAETLISSSNTQEVTLVVKEQLRVRIALDGAPAQVQTFEPGEHELTFDGDCQLLIFDASRVEVLFNGKSVGPLGEPGRVRRIGFAASSASSPIF